MPGDPRLQRCGFAKLQGEGIEFFMRRYEITMGRNSKNSTLDLILGDSTTISRQHASIRYNFDTKQFELVVLGKNGVSVDHGDGNFHLYTPESPPTALKSRDLLMLGEKKFYFLLPRTLGSRKRRRTEASPAPTGAPAPVAAAPAAPVAAAAPAAAPAGPHAAQPHVAPQPHVVPVAPQPPSAVAPVPQAAAAAAAVVQPGAADPGHVAAAVPPPQVRRRGGRRGEGSSSGW